MLWDETVILKIRGNSVLEILRVTRYGRDCGNNTESRI